MVEQTNATQDVVRNAVDAWLAAHPQFRHTDWVLSKGDESNGRYRRWTTRVEPPFGGVAFDVDVYLSHAALFTGRTSISIPFPSNRLARSGLATEQEHAGRRVVRFIDDLANGRVRVRGDSGAPSGYRTYRAGRFGWHEVKDGRQGRWQRFVARLFGS